MGCHTWFWNEWKHIPKKDIKALIEYRSKKQDNKTFEEYRSFMQKFFEDCVKDGDYDMAEYLRHQINSKTQWKKDELLNRYRKRITKRKISRHELIGLLRKLDDIFYPSKYYEVPEKYSDNFRIYDYEAEPWYSVKDFENYIKNNPNTKIECKSDNPYEYAKSILKEFFNEYPHGMVDLG